MVSDSRARELVARHGPTRPQPADEWSGEFRLPDALQRYYLEVGPLDIEIPGHADSFVLPSLSALWSFQGGYRWNTRTGERIAEWDDDWLVVAFEAGDAIIFERSTGRILSAMHGAGVWEPHEAFDDINTMAAAMSLLGSIIVDAGDDFMDDSCEIRPTHRSAAQRALVEGLGIEAAVAGHILGVLGWE